MRQQSQLAKRLTDEIEAGGYGASGSRFPTIRELAVRCDVSYVTAQRAFNALRTDGYLRTVGAHTYLTTGAMRADAPLAQVLRELRGTDRRLGLHLSRIDNLFFSSLAAQLIPILERHGWQLIVMSSGGDPEAERRIIDSFIELGAAGIFTCPGRKNVYANCVLPVVCLGRSVIGGNSVQVNNKGAGAQMAAHMLEEGYRHFLYVGTDALPAEQDYRLIGFQKQLAAGGYRLPTENIFTLNTADPAKDGHLHLIRRRIRALDGPVGIFCYHDLLAFGILEMCRRSEIDVPGKVGVAGFDDLQSADYMGTRLTTISYRYDQMTERAAELMLRLLLEPEPVLHEDIFVNQALTVRGSTMLKN